MQTAAVDDWDRHWSDYAQSAKSNPAQQYRKRLLFSLLNLGAAEARVLDIGSGQGDFAFDLQRRYSEAKLLGLELSATGVEIARKRIPSGTFLQRNLLAPLAPDEAHGGWATHAVCSEVLEHVDDPAALLRNAAHYMDPNCRLVVTVPGGPMSAFDRHIGHRVHYTPESLRALLESAGFEVKLSAGAGYPFFNLYRKAVILRGERLIEDVAQGSGAATSLLARAVTAVFDVLLHWNWGGGNKGWQMIAVAQPRR